MVTLFNAEILKETLAEKQFLYDLVVIYLASLTALFNSAL
jgi:hypothetical protein